MKTTLLSALTVALGLFLFSASASASPITIDTLQPASATTNFESIRVGVAGQGGVTFFNGSVLNESGPYVIADDLRIDGSIWRGPSKGTGDNQAIKIADSMHPALTAANDLGSSEFQWNNAYFAGDVQVGNLQGTNIIHENNISNNSITSSKIQNGTIQGQDLATAYQDGSAYDSRFVSGVSAGTGLSGGGTSGDVTLSLASNYRDGSAYDSRFVSRSAPTWNDRTGYVAVPSAAFRPSVDGYDYSVLDVVLSNEDGLSDLYSAEVYLPHGATVTRLDFYWNDTDASNDAVIAMWTRTYSGSSLDVMASASSTGSGGQGSSYDNSISSPGVNNNTNYYIMKLSIPTQLTDFYSAKITYTYDQP